MVITIFVCQQFATVFGLELLLKMAVSCGSTNMPRLEPVFAVADNVRVVDNCQWMGICGVVVHFTCCWFVIVNDAGFCSWFGGSELVHTFGPDCSIASQQPP